MSLTEFMQLSLASEFVTQHLDRYVRVSEKETRHKNRNFDLKNMGICWKYRNFSKISEFIGHIGIYRKYRNFSVKSEFLENIGNIGISWKYRNFSKILEFLEKIRISLKYQSLSEFLRNLGISGNIFYSHRGCVIGLFSAK